MEYRKRISPYLEKRRQEVKKETTLRDVERYVNWLLDFSETSCFGVSDDELIKAYSDILKERGYSSATITKKIIPECKKFITWCLSQKGEDIMTDADIEVKSDMAAVNEVQRGRKLKGKEARTQKVSLYMPPKLYEQINDLAHFARKSVGDILIELTEGYVKDNARKLEIFRRAIQEAQESE